MIALIYAHKLVSMDIVLLESMEMELVYAKKIMIPQQIAYMVIFYISKFYQYEFF